MARIKKSASDKEKELLEIISDAKKKLAKLQSKQKQDIGELACKCGLQEFDLKTLEEEFKKLADKLISKK